MNEQILKDFIATAQKYNYNWNTVIPKFPELKNYDAQLLKDYVATAEKYNYDYSTVNSKFPEFGFAKPKKKEPTVLPSASAQEPSLSATQPKKKQQPSVSSSGGGKIYKGYPNKESKEYFLKEGVWYERPNNGGNGWTPITDRNRIKSIYDFFVNKSDYKSAQDEKNAKLQEARLKKAEAEAEMSDAEMAKVFGWSEEEVIKSNSAEKITPICWSYCCTCNCCRSDCNGRQRSSQCSQSECRHI
jgi:hypothetical protein